MRPDILHSYFKAVTSLHGVGPALANTLTRLFDTQLASLPLVRDVLFHAPVDIIDRRFSPPLHSAPADTVCTFEVRIDAHHPPGTRMTHASKKPHRVQCSNETGDMMLVFFHSPKDWLEKSLPVGQTRIISGKTEHFDFRLQMTHPDIIAPLSEREKVLVVEPQYPLTQGLSNKKLRQLIQHALSHIPTLPEWYSALPAPLQPMLSTPFNEALKQLHHPQCAEDLKEEHPARARLAFDELVAEQLSLHQLRTHHAAQPGILLISQTNCTAPSPPHPAHGGTSLTHPACGGGKGGAIPFPTPPAASPTLPTPLAGGARGGMLPVSGAYEKSPPIPPTSDGENKNTPPTIPKETSIWQSLEAALPFTLTPSQREVLNDIASGLASGKRYIRLLQGDVGSGKTIIALFAMLRAVENGYQAALMVPTELVAQQHYYKLRELAEPLGVKLTYLTGSVKGQARQQALADIASGDAHMVIGTHALFQEKVTFQKLAVVVIDEQHRFGVDQRMALVKKGNQPHILHMTATPIPRSLMMTYYGDMQPLYLKEKPAGRLPITTRAIPISRSSELLQRMEAALANHEKIYWICPQIEAGEQQELFEQDIAAVTLRYTEFKTRFGEQQVGLIHGRIPQEERDKTMRSFARGDLRMIVATTVVEVGVDVPDATIMIIESAERFGLSQLHQLRGRVGRGNKPSFCILLYRDQADETARKRLSALREHEDGFAIADMDYELRGGGELLGTRQSGARRYRFAKPSHMALLPEAHSTAKAIAGTAEADILRELFL